MMLYTVFCDESCHLQKDNSSIMVLGAMYCLSEKEKNKILFRYSCKSKKSMGWVVILKIKWTKVSEIKDWVLFRIAWLFLEKQWFTLSWFGSYGKEINWIIKNIIMMITIYGIIKCISEHLIRLSGKKTSIIFCWI